MSTQLSIFISTIDNASSVIRGVQSSVQGLSAIGSVGSSMVGLGAAIGKLRTTTNGYLAYCNGCKMYHVFDKRWTFNGNYQSPTFSPSLVVEDEDSKCHSFLTDGVWHYLDDCTHELRCQLSPLRSEI